VTGGECHLVSSPTYVVLGKTRYDQGWIDRTSEAIIVGCKQPRPKARPASLDAPAKTPTPAPVQPKKRKFRIFTTVG
jgi:hypothetical protein